MRVFLVHNYYEGGSGGEDSVFAAERELLRRNGNEVFVYTDTNNGLHDLGPLRAAVFAAWSPSSYSKIRTLIRLHRPDVAHFHNIFFMISPSAYFACENMGVPVVQTLHNYRLMCPAAVFYRGGAVCEDCLGKSVAWPAVVHACYRRSRPQSAAVTAVLGIHRAARTWQRRVGTYIALTEFSRRKFIEGGLPAAKIAVKPNFVFDEAGRQLQIDRGYAVYVGRLSAEKGLLTLLRAWEQLGAIPLRIAGDGPLRGEVEAFAAAHDAIEYVGQLEPEPARALIKSARFLIAPSVCFENFPRALVEAFSCKTPVLGSRLGAVAELMDDGETGRLVAPGDPRELAAQARWLWEHPEDCLRMGENARREYELKYTPERNYQMLAEIYSKAIADHGK